MPMLAPDGQTQDDQALEQIVMQVLEVESLLQAGQKELLKASVKLCVFTLTHEQRTKILRELFTAIYADGEATESFKVLRAYFSYFSLEMQGMVREEEKFSYANHMVDTVRADQVDMVSLEQMLAVKTGNHKDLPPALLHKLFCNTQKAWAFDDELVKCSNGRQKFHFDFAVDNQQSLWYEYDLDQRKTAIRAKGRTHINKRSYDSGGGASDYWQEDYNTPVLPSAQPGGQNNQSESEERDERYFSTTSEDESDATGSRRPPTS